MCTVGSIARMRRMSATPPDTSGSRGSTITTSGRWSADQGDGLGDLAGAPDDGEAVSDAEDPDQALARAVIGVDDEQAEPAGDR